MSTTIVQQPFPAYVKLLSRVPVYVHFVQSIVAIFVLWACPSLRPKMPTRRVVYKLRAWSSHSLRSTTSTLVEFSSDKYAEVTRERHDTREESEVPAEFHNPFSDPTSPSKTSPNTAFAPSALPACNLTSIIPPSTPNPSLIPPLITFPKAELWLRSRLWTPLIDDCCFAKPAGQTAEATMSEGILAPTSLKRSTGFKRVAKKARTLLLMRRRP